MYFIGRYFIGILLEGISLEDVILHKGHKDKMMKLHIFVFFVCVMAKQLVPLALGMENSTHEDHYMCYLTIRIILIT